MADQDRENYFLERTFKFQKYKFFKRNLFLGKITC